MPTSSDNSESYRGFSWATLLITISVVLVAGISLYFLHLNQLRGMAGGIRVQADKFRDESNWKMASSYYGRYLAMNPPEQEAAKVRSVLAETFRKSALSIDSRQRCVELFERAVQKGDPEKKKDHLNELMQLKIELRRFNEAEADARRFLTENPDDPVATSMLAKSLFLQLETGALAGLPQGEKKVLSTLIRARDLNPTSLDMAVFLANIYRNPKYEAAVLAERPNLDAKARLQEADAALDQFVNNNPKSAEAYLARYRYRKEFETPGYEEDLRTAYQFGRDNEVVLLICARHNLEKAKQYAREGRSNDDIKALCADSVRYFDELLAAQEAKNQIELRSLAARILLEKGEAQAIGGDIQGALETWSRGSEQYPGERYIFAAKKADALLEKMRFDEADEPMRYLDTFFGSLTATKLDEIGRRFLVEHQVRKGIVFLQRQQPIEAIKVLREAQTSPVRGERSQATEWRILVSLGAANAQLGEWEQAADYYEKAVAEQPMILGPQLQAARCWLNANRPELAKRRCDILLTRFQSSEALYQSAASQLKIALRQDPESRDWTPFLTTLEALKKGLSKDPLEAPWNVNLLELDYAFQTAKNPGRPDANELNEAIGRLKSAEVEFKEKIEFWKTLAIIYARLEQPNEIDRCVSEIRRLGNDSQAELARARALVTLGKKDEAESLLQQLVRSAKGQELSTARRELATVLVRERQFAEARQVLVAEHESSPKDLSVLRKLVEIDLDLNRLGEVENWEKKIRTVGPQGEYLALFARAFRLLFEKNGTNKNSLDEAHKAADTICQSLRPNWYEAWTLRGLIESKQGKNREALESLVKARELGEDRLFAIEKLVGLLDQMGQTLKANDLMRPVRDQVAFSQILTLAESRNSILQNNPESAKESAQRGVEARPNDPIAHVWLGRVLAYYSDPAGAEASFRKAVEIAPKDLRTWGALFGFYVQSSKPQKAKEVLVQVENESDAAGEEKLLMLANGYEFIRNREAAAKFFEKASMAYPNSLKVHLQTADFFLRTEPSRAEGPLRRALEASPDAGDARRKLAFLVARRAQSSDSEWTEVEQLIGPNSGRPFSAEDSRLFARLTLERGGVDRVQEAVRAIETIVTKSGDAAPGDRFLLAGLYERQSVFAVDDNQSAVLIEKAKDEMRIAATSRNPDPAHIKWFIEFLARQGETAAASQWVSTLEDEVEGRSKGDPNAVAVLIEVLLTQKKFDAAGKWIEILRTIDRDPLRPLAFHVRHLAATSDDARRLADKAIQDVTKPITQSLAKQNERLVAVLKRIGDIYMAVDRPDDAEKWYRVVWKQQPANYEPLIHTLGKQGKFDEAAKVYEEIDDPTVRPILAILSIYIQKPEKAKVGQTFGKVIEKAKQEYPNDPRVLYSLATIYTQNGQRDEAIRVYREIIASNPRHAAALNNLANLLGEAPQTREEALELIDRAISVTGANASLYDTKGAILVYAGRGPEAIPLLKIAARSPDHDPRHLLHLAAAHLQNGDVDSARTTYAQCRQLKLEDYVLTKSDENLVNDLDKLAN